MSLRSLHIAYVLTGAQRGYTLSADAGVPADAQKAIWREALPRGQGWDDPAFTGARSLHCWPLGAGMAALSHTTITDQRDELGRGGIKQAHIVYGTLREIATALHDRLTVLPGHTLATAESALASQAWGLLFSRYRENMPAMKPRTLLTFPYTPAGWLFIEACMLLLATRATLLANLIEVTPQINPLADRMLSFVTLTLDPREQSRLLALPAAHAARWPGVPMIALPTNRLPLLKG